jgi:hypothetical protein
MQLSADTVRGHSGHRLANTIEPRLTVDCPMRPPRGVPVHVLPVDRRSLRIHNELRGGDATRASGATLNPT